MVRLISGTAAIIFATATLASAAPRQGVPSRPSTAARAKTVKPLKSANRKARKTVPPTYRKRTAPTKPATFAPKPFVRPQTPAAAETVAIAKHDPMAEELEVKRLKASVKTAQKAGDARRVARDRREMYQLEAHVRADKADMKDAQRHAKAGGKKRSRIPFWGWWRS